MISFIKPFNKFEWMIAIRYLRSKRSDGGISAMTWISLIGISFSKSVKSRRFANFLAITNFLKISIKISIKHRSYNFKLLKNLVIFICKL